MRTPPAALLRAFLDAEPDPVVAVDPEGTVLFWSRSAERVFGWSADEVEGEIAPMVHPDDRESFLRRTEDFLRGLPLRGRRVRKIRSDGEEVPTLVFPAPLEIPEDGAGGVLFVFRPVPEDASLEHRLLESERRFRDLFDQAADALVLHTPDGSRILEVNRETCDSLGYTRAELLSMSIPEVVRNPGPPERTSRVRDLPVGERIEGVSAVHRRKDDSEFPVEVQLAALE